MAIQIEKRKRAEYKDENHNRPYLKITYEDGRIDFTDEGVINANISALELQIADHPEVQKNLSMFKQIKEGIK